MAALALALALAPALASAQCQTSGTSWKNAPFAAQTAAFGASFDATPNMAKMDGVTGLSFGAASGFTSLAVIVRFNSLGYFDARNGGSYAAAASIPYSAGLAYHVRLAVDPTKHTYSAYVTPPSGSEQTLASNYAFRTEQALTSTLNDWALYADSGSHQVCNFTLAGGVVAPPSVAITAPAAGAAVSGSVTVSANAGSSLGIANVQFQVDGTNLGSAVSVPPYATTWNTTSASNASHTLGAVASDVAGTKAAATESVTVSNAVLPPPPSSCVTAGTSWQSTAFASQSAAFGASFDATPSMAAMDGVTGLSLNAASGFSSLAAIVRFNSAGNIDARNGGGYAAAAAMPYAVGQTYHIRLAVDPVSHTYSVYVTPPGGAETPLGIGYAFRTEQALTSSLNDWALFADAGTHQVCNFALAAGGGGTTPPTISLTAPAPGATLSGTVTVSAGASAAAGVKSVQFQVDGSNLGAALTASPYNASWNTTADSNAVHTLSAVVTDSLGATATASESVTVSNAAVTGTDPWGIKEVYPTPSGGLTWFSSWDNGVSRTFTGVDPKDPWFDANHGDATYNVDGKGLFYISGPVPRMYIHDPVFSREWRNVEMTVYAMRISDAGTPWGGVEGVARTNHAAYPPGISDSTDLCDTRGNDARFRYDGHIDFEKETSHPNSVAIQNKAMWSTLPYNQWLGYKLVVYDLANGDVKLENYMDLTDGANGGTWNKVNEVEDTGSNFGVGGVPCASGIDPALRLTNSDARPGSESGKPNATVYWRSDDVGTNGLIYKRMSVRQISAP